MKNFLKYPSNENWKYVTRIIMLEFFSQIHLKIDICAYFIQDHLKFVIMKIIIILKY
jgi:hypothetical protein